MNLRIRVLLNPKIWDRLDIGRSKRIYCVKNQLLPSTISLKTLDKHGYTYVYVEGDDQDPNVIHINCGIYPIVPLFYRVTKGYIIVSDNPDKLAFGRVSINEDALIEFLYFLSALGGKTLIKQVNLLQAGQFLRYDIGRVSIEDYFIYDFLPEKELDEETLLEELWQKSKKVFSFIRELVQRNLKFIVPLSGGYDSRFIAAMLRLLGVRDVLCVCYGLPNNYETQISKKVAEKLGYDWIFIDYSWEKWKTMVSWPEFLKYCIDIHSYYTTPNIQEYLMVKFLKETLNGNEGKYVFLPGDTGDFTGGGHITREIYSHGYSSENVITLLLRNPWVIFRKLPPSPKLLTLIKEYISDLYLSYGLSKPLPAYKICEAFDWREKQAKFIASTRRAYIAHNYKFLIPLWDREFADFWSSVPLKFKYGKKLYRKFLLRYIFSPLGIDFGRGDLPLPIKFSLHLEPEVIKLRKSLGKIRQVIKKRYLPYDPCGFHIILPALRTAILANEKWRNGHNFIETIKRRYDIGDPNHFWSYMAEIAIIFSFSKLRLI